MLAKTTVYAGVDGWVEQFILRPGDVVNPMLRPAGILVPADAGRVAIQAGFGQIEAQVIRKGMIGEVTCMAIPFAVIPVVVTEVQSVIASGQVRPTDQLVDPMQAAQPGTITAYLTPLVLGQLGSTSAGQPLHRQRLHQQSRRGRSEKDLSAVHSVCTPRNRRGGARSCCHPSAPGAAAARPHPGPGWWASS